MNENSTNNNNFKRSLLNVIYLKARLLYVPPVKKNVVYSSEIKSYVNAYKLFATRFDW